jgi:hypothetical protein
MFKSSWQIFMTFCHMAKVNAHYGAHNLKEVWEYTKYQK